jgi:hypothetical protein
MQQFLLRSFGHSRNQRRPKRWTPTPPLPIKPPAPPGLGATSARFTSDPRTVVGFAPSPPIGYFNAALTIPSITAAAGDQSPRFDASHHLRPIKMLSYHRLLDNASSPTESRRPGCFLNLRDELDQAAVAIRRRSASTGHLPPFSTAGELTKGLHNHSSPSQRQAVPEPAASAPSASGAARSICCPW